MKQKKILMIAALAVIMMTAFSDGKEMVSATENTTEITNDDGTTETYTVIEGDYEYGDENSTWKLNENTIITGNLYLISEKGINLNGKNLIVSGDLYQSDGAMSINGGTLGVTGDYYLATKENEESNGRIAMQKPDAEVLAENPDAVNTIRIGGSFCNRSNPKTYSSQLEMGTIEIGGDFYQYGEIRNFSPHSNCYVIFKGTSKVHTVYFDAPAVNGFTSLEVEEDSMLNFTSGIPSLILGSDIRIGNGNRDSSYTIVGTIDLNKKSLTIDDNLNLDKTSVVIEKVEYPSVGKVDINCGILKVNGDLYQPDGVINMSHDYAENGGTLEISGDYYLQGNKNIDNPSPSAGYIRMLRDGDTVKIGGSFYNYGISAGYQSGNTFSAGTMYIGGDFCQYGAENRNFAADTGGTHTVILNGKGEQKVHFDYPGDWSIQSKVYGNYFKHLELKNENVRFASVIPGWTLSENTKLGNGLPNGMIGRFDLAGQTLTIEGDLYQQDGGMILNGGRLEVTGDYHLQAKDSNGKYILPIKNDDIYSKGYIHMVNDKDYVKIGGDFYVCSGGSSRSNMNLFENGTMEISGNLYQYGGSKVCNFDAITPHTVILNGSEKQTVSFAYIENSGFGNLILTKDKETDYVLPSKTCWTNLYQVIPQISVTPDNYVVQKGGLQVFTVNVEFADIDGKALPEGILLDSSVTWSVEGRTSVSTIINANGELTVGADENADNLTVKAASVWNPEKMASVEVIVGKMVSPDVTGVKLAGHSLSLNGNIAVNFYMELPEAVRTVTDAYMHFTLPNGTAKDVAVSEAEQENGYYIFTCEVSAKEMTGEIKAQMFVNEKAGTEYLYAVKKYADYILSHQDVYGTKVVELVKAMLNYGTYSQIYFDYNTENPANAALTDAEKTLGAVSLNENYKAVITGDEGVATFSATLVLKSKTALNVYVKLADGVAFEKMKFAIDYGKGHEEVTPVKNGEYYVMTVNGINASNLDTMFQFKVSAEDGKVRELTYGPMSYCYRILNEDTYKDELKLKDVVSALYHFNVAADNYHQ